MLLKLFQNTGPDVTLAPPDELYGYTLLLLGKVVGRIADNPHIEAWTKLIEGTVPEPAGFGRWLLGHWEGVPELGEMLTDVRARSGVFFRLPFAASPRCGSLHCLCRPSADAKRRSRWQEAAEKVRAAFSAVLKGLRDSMAPDEAATLSALRVGAETVGEVLGRMVDVQAVAGRHADCGVDSVERAIAAAVDGGRAANRASVQRCLADEQRTAAAAGEPETEAAAAAAAEPEQEPEMPPGDWMDSARGSKAARQEGDKVLLTAELRKNDGSWVAARFLYEVAPRSLLRASSCQETVLILSRLIENHGCFRPGTSCRTRTGGSTSVATTQPRVEGRAAVKEPFGGPIPPAPRSARAERGE